MENHHIGVINSFVDESNSHGQATAFEKSLGGYANVNEYPDLDCPYEEINIYQQIPELKVQREKSHDRLSIDGQRVDDASISNNHATENVSQNMEESLDELLPAIYASIVDKNKSSSTNCVNAAVDKSEPKQNQ